MTTFVHEVTFPNYVDDITIAGTLTLPTMGDNFPVVLLIADMHL